MALPTAAAFMSEIEDDRQSVASAATSVWDGMNNAPVNALRESRKAVNVLRRQLTAEHARIKSLDEEDFKDEFIDADTMRYNFGQAILRHVNMARQTASEHPDHANFILTRVANSVGVLRDAWNKTAYFGQEVASISRRWRRLRSR